jgi:periplasmic divalent cation tolerance protein
VTDLCEVVITAPDPEWLLQFAHQLVADRLASSAHNFTPVRSVYRWQREIFDREEGRVALHTRKSLVSRIVERANEQHPYEVPGVSTRPIDDGNPAYLQWIRDQTQQTD